MSFPCPNHPPAARGASSSRRTFSILPRRNGAKLSSRKSIRVLAGLPTMRRWKSYASRASGTCSQGPMELSRMIYRATRRIPPGQVATYADIARSIGRPRAWRHVGNALNRNRDPDTPCHRVVRSDGRVGGFGYPGGVPRKIQRLRREGIPVDGGCVDLRRYRIRSPRVLRR